MKSLKDKVSITLDSNIIQKIKDMAEEDDRNFNQYINMVPKEWVKIMTNNTFMEVANLDSPVFSKYLSSLAIILSSIPIYPKETTLA